MQGSNKYNGSAAAHVLSSASASYPLSTVAQVPFATTNSLLEQLHEGTLADKLPRKHPASTKVAPAGIPVAEGPGCCSIG